MKLQLSTRASNIFVIGYILVTLYLRFMLEVNTEAHIGGSVSLGIMSLLLLWALYKSGFIRPSFFGLDKPKVSTTKK